MTNRMLINEDTATLNAEVLASITRLENNTAVRSIKLADVMGDLASNGVRTKVFYDDRKVDRALQYLKGAKKADYVRKSEVGPDLVWGWLTVKTASRVRVK